MKINVQHVATNHWLLLPGAKIFHAYVVVGKGEKPVCGKNLPITDFKSMNVPGERSLCCIHCFSGLYGCDVTVDSTEGA